MKIQIFKPLHFGICICKNSLDVQHFKKLLHLEHFSLGLVSYLSKFEILSSGGAFGQSAPQNSNSQTVFTQQPFTQNSNSIFGQTQTSSSNTSVFGQQSPAAQQQNSGAFGPTSTGELYESFDRKRELVKY